LNNLLLVRRERLNKQILEAFQLLELMVYPQRKGWRNHRPLDVDGYDLALIDYGLAMCLEWTGRGYKEHSLEDKFENTQWFILRLEILSFQMVGKGRFSTLHTGLIFSEESRMVFKIWME